MMRRYIKMRLPWSTVPHLIHLSRKRYHAGTRTSDLLHVNQGLSAAEMTTPVVAAVRRLLRRRPLLVDWTGEQVLPLAGNTCS